MLYRGLNDVVNNTYLQRNLGLGLHKEFVYRMTVFGQCVQMDALLDVHLFLQSIFPN